MISYSKVQGVFAERLHEQLRKHDYSPRLSGLDIAGGERWRPTVNWWLSACRLAVVLLSEDAIESPWVRYELSVLTNRENVERSMRLMLVYVGVERADVSAVKELEPLALGEIQSFEVPSADLDDDEVADLAEKIKVADEPADRIDPPVERLVTRVGAEVRKVAPEHLAAARNELDGVEDPWGHAPAPGPTNHEASVLAFSRAYCETPLERVYRALQTIAQDRRITVDDLNELIDFNVMTAFDSRLVDRLHRAQHHDGRRSLVTATTRTDLAEVSTQAVTVLHGPMFTYRFVVTGPVTGLTHEDIAEGLADELRYSISATYREEADDFLAAVARRNHPVFVLLTGADGLDKEVLRLLEERFPSVVFVVLSSTETPMARLAERLEVDGVGTDIDDDTGWAEYVGHERDLATERSGLRDDVRRLKLAQAS